MLKVVSVVSPPANDRWWESGAHESRPRSSLTLGATQDVIAPVAMLSGSFAFQ